jgi:hypothetical protein
LVILDRNFLKDAMKKSRWLSRVVPAFMALLVATCNLLDAQTQTKPTLPDDANAFPRSKEGNMIVTVVDLVYAAQESDLQVPFKGVQTVELIGQMMPDTANSANGNRFRLMRMFSPIEANAATPVTLLVESATKPKFSESRGSKWWARWSFGCKTEGQSQ